MLPQNVIFQQHTQQPLRPAETTKRTKRMSLCVRTSLLYQPDADGLTEQVKVTLPSAVCRHNTNGFALRVNDSIPNHLKENGLNWRWNSLKKNTLKMNNSLNRVVLLLGLSVWLVLRDWNMINVTRNMKFTLRRESVTNSVIETPFISTTAGWLRAFIVKGRVDPNYLKCNNCVVVRLSLISSGFNRKPEEVCFPSDNRIPPLSCDHMSFISHAGCSAHAHNDMYTKICTQHTSQHRH